MKETKLKNWSFDIGSFTYKIPKDKQEEIKSSKKQDILIKYNMYIISQSSKGVDHYISLDDFEKIYNKCKKASKDTLKDYTNQIVSDKVNNMISIYANHVYDHKLNVNFKSAYNPNHIINYEYIPDENTLLTSMKQIRVKDVTDLENLNKFNKDFKLVPGSEFPLLIFIKYAIDYKYYPEEDSIYDYCKRMSADFNSALNVIYEHRGRKYIV